MYAIEIRRPNKPGWTYFVADTGIIIDGIKPFNGAKYTRFEDAEAEAKVIQGLYPGIRTRIVEIPDK